MIKSVTIINFHGDILKMSLREPEQSGFLITYINGLGPVKADINTTDIATDDGSLFNSARANQRNIVMGIQFVDDIYNDSIEMLRHKTYKYFPLKKQITVIIETDHRIVETTGYVESNEPNIFSKLEGTQISIICAESYFRAVSEEKWMDILGNQDYPIENDPRFFINEKGELMILGYKTPSIMDFRLNGKELEALLRRNSLSITKFTSIENIFEFPFSNNSLETDLIEFSSVKTNKDVNVVYNGDVDIGITIRIHAIGKCINPKIISIDTLGTMLIDTHKLEQLTGKGIVASDDIIITTMKRNKRIVLIREGKEYNILNCLDKNSEWFTLTKGDNLFGITAESGFYNLQISIENTVLFEGI